MAFGSLRFGGASEASGEVGLPFNVVIAAESQGLDAGMVLMTDVPR